MIDAIEIPAGWRLVPIVADHDMTAAAGVRPTDDRSAMAEAWRRMCLAAPPPPAPVVTLEQHTQEVGRFLSELAETMGIETFGVVEVADMCRLIIERARADREEAQAWTTLRNLFREPQFLTITHQGASDHAKRYAEVKFAYHGIDALTRSDAMHDAILAAGIAAKP